MANIALQFLGNREPEYHDRLEVFANTNNEIHLIIENGQDDCCDIVLDLPTAIRFDKELRKQIGIIKNNKDND